MRRRAFLGLGAAALLPLRRSPSTLYVGTYGSSIGIVTYDGNGKLTAAGKIAGVSNASFLVRDGNHLYAVNEDDAGAVTAIDISGTPKVLNRQPNQGSGPCHLARVGNYLLSANYGSGDVAVHNVNQDGSIGEQTDLVKHEGAEPHAHQVVATGSYILAVDLGTDSIYTYTLDAGRLTLRHQTEVAVGAGPRHLTLDSTGQFAYVADELDSTVTTCAYDDGVLTVLSTQPAAPNGPTNYPGEIVTSKDGRFVYVTNRGHNSIAIFRATSATLELVGTPSSGGDWPRHCAFDPSGRFLFVSNQNSGNIATFVADPATGLLTQTSNFATPTPVCVA